MKTVKIEKQLMPDFEGNDDSKMYPYGTSLRIQDDLVDKLGLSNINTGDKISIKGLALITSKSSYETDNDNEVEKSITIQFTDISVDTESVKNQDRLKILYGDS